MNNSFFDSQSQKRLEDRIAELKTEGFYLEPKVVQYSVSMQVTYVIKNDRLGGEFASSDLPEKAWLMAIRIIEEKDRSGPPLPPGSVSRDT